jgi:hypothetical protein
LAFFYVFLGLPGAGILLPLLLHGTPSWRTGALAIAPVQSLSRPSIPLA